jgi:phospho-N-acetylmuramoyl-pentapeptide-transferase
VTVAIVSGALGGALLGYLIFNAYPTKVFMGDTGSLAIGAYVASAAIVLRMGWFILIFGLLYLIEVVSVILQVGFFKLTHGKRLFKMAPIHHHFEKCGWSETRIVAAFTAFTLFMCLVSWLAG